MVGELLVQLAPHESAGLLAFPERALAFLRERLKRAPHLVVVDNLETVADLEALLPTLRAGRAHQVPAHLAQAAH